MKTALVTSNTYKNHITGKIETMNMDFLYEQIKSFFKDKPHIKSLLNIFKDSYVKKKNFSEATRILSADKFSRSSGLAKFKEIHEA